MKYSILLLFSFVSIISTLKAQTKNDAIIKIKKQVSKIKHDVTLKPEKVKLPLSEDKYDENNLVVYKKANQLFKIEYYEKKGWAWWLRKISYLFTK